MLKECAPLPPSGFFEIGCTIPKKSSLKQKTPFLLPDTSFLLGEESFADLSLSWDEMGIYAKVLVKKKYEERFYPDVQKGDSIELFIDTRDLKTANTLTEFCHHFVFLPKAVDGGFCGYEVTRFTKEAAHEIADSNLFDIETRLKRFSYEMEIFLPKTVLFGYDPTNCHSIGFTYRINRYGKASQHFTVSSKFYAFETRPELWASVKCIEDL